MEPPEITPAWISATKVWLATHGPEVELLDKGTFLSLIHI